MRESKANPHHSVARDNGFSLRYFAQQCWVECPACGKPALARLQPHFRRADDRLTCAHCGHNEARSTRHMARAKTATAWQYPSCFRCGQNLRGKRKGRPFQGNVRATIRCRGCGASGDYLLLAAPPEIAEGVDPTFGYPLFLRTPIGNEELWVLNPEHLAHLQNYLEAGMRKRFLGPSNMTMMARLPRWMKLAKNRKAVVHGLARLEAKARQLGERR